MANRYWVGGTANWDGTAGTKWAATSGGAGGASVPTSADDVFFDANSGASTVTVTATANCLSLNFTGFTGTFAGTSGVFINGGNLTIASGMTWTHSGTLTFSAGTGTYTVTSNGKAITSGVNFGSSGISTATWTLGDAFNTSNAITVTSGTFTTNNFNVTATALLSTNTNTRTINLGSSTVTVSANTAIDFLTPNNLTFNAGTSQINVSGVSAEIRHGGLAFWNITYTSTSVGTRSIFGDGNYSTVGSCNNLTINGPSVAGVVQFTFDYRFTINGTLSTTGTAGNRRVWFRSTTYGLARTLTINSAPSLTDADFRDIYVIGTAAPISGTRVGNLRGCSGITFSTPKTVYWVTAAGGNWSGNNWAATSGGAASTDNFPLAQDTAVIENTGLNASATVTLDNAVANYATVDMSTRTNAVSFSTPNNITFYGNLICGSGTSPTSSGTLTFSGRNTQTITSAGKSFANGFVIDSYGGTVQLADALNIGASTLTVTNGTFDTKNYNVTAGSLSSSNSNVRTITLGSSTVTLSNTIGFSTSTNLTFNAGTSQINIAGASVTVNGGGLTYNNVTFTGAINAPITGTNTFNNLTVTAPAAAGIIFLQFSANQTITGTLTVAGATAVRRIFLQSDTLGTTRTLTVGTLSAQDCDFRDITIAGAAAGSSPTRAGDCGGNTGITFPAPKTVYWNLAGAQNWSSTGWASSSGGSPAVNNFPLAQDTAVFDNTGAGSSCGFDAAWNVGTFDASARTSAFTFNMGAASVYKDWKFGTGITAGSTGSTVTFSGRSTQTITSNGVTFSNPITINCITGTVQLADALSLNSARTLTLTSGTFDAVSYNVTAGLFVTSGAVAKTLKMGSGTWTLSGTGTIWDASASNTTFYKGTANIVLSDTSTSARTFNTGALSYNKLTIGGTTGTSTLTFAQNGQFTELASTKTVAHTIDIGTNGTTQTFGKWTVTGTLGNVVTMNAGGTIIIAGGAVTGVDYLAMGTTALSTTSPGEFYAGANSTGTGTGITLTAPPASRTLYWVGGTGNWSDTARWSTSSGGASGAAIPTSLDDVIFNSASNATAYTATVNAPSRCKTLTINGPASGNLTLSSSSTNQLIAHDNVTFAATGVVWGLNAGMVLSGSTTGRTFTGNNISMTAIGTDVITINGVGSAWALGSAANLGNNAGLNVFNGDFSTANYTLAAANITSSSSNKRSITLGSSTVTLTGALAAINFGSTENSRADLTLSAGTSQINLAQLQTTFGGNNQTFYNVSFTSTATNTITINGANTFNNLTFAGVASAGSREISISANQTITGTLTCSAGTNATMRHFLRSNTLGTTRTITAAAVSLTDVDFRDITIAGAAAPASGTRLGDGKGNSGITFPAAKTVYWNLAAGGNWSATAWATSSGGGVAANNFPLAQDTAIIENTGLNTSATVTIDATYNIGTISMSTRSNAMTLATGSTTPTIYGNWVNGSGTTLTGSGILTFAGRGAQTITSAGKTWTQPFDINTPGGSVTLQDAFTSNISGTATCSLSFGTFDAAGYNVTFSGANTFFSSVVSTTRTLALGSGTWSLAGTVWSTNGGLTGLTITGTATISMTSASAKTFAGGGTSLYSGITLNQGGAGALTITGNNTFKDITNTYSATGAANITIGTTTQTVTQWTATGAATRVLTVQGTSASSPGTLILSSGSVNVDYLTITGVRAYPLETTWYAGSNSTNNGSLGFIFSSGGTTYSATVAETATATDAISALMTFLSSLSETATATDSVNAPGSTYNPSVAETATATDSTFGGILLLANVDETATATDATVGYIVFPASVSETATASDATAALANFSAILAETASITDAVSALASLGSVVVESVSASDLVSAGLFYSSAVAETATATDSDVGYVAFLVSISELASITDSSSAIATFSPQVNETATGTDDVNAPGSTYNPALAETATATDSDVGYITFPVSVAESATATDAILSFPIFNGNVLETVTISDSTSTAVTFTPSVQESATATDTPTVAPSTFNAPVVEFATATDTPSAAATFRVSVAETAQALDFLVGGYLWNPIDDTQTANWQNINNVQSAGWTVINDTQAPGWQDIEEFK